MRVVSLRSTILAVAATGAFALAGCSDNSSDEPRFDPDRADELAHEMMPDAGAFPGTGWKVVAEDEFDDEDEEETPTPEACEEIEEDIGAPGDFVDEEPAGRAQTEYQAKSAEDDPFALPTSIDLEVEIHEESDGLKEALNSLKDLLGDPRFADCMDAIMAEEIEQDPAEEGFEIEFQYVESEATVPRNGASMAFDATITVGDVVSVDMHAAIFFWRVGNAGITAMFTGGKDALTDEFMNAALDRIDGAAIIASKK